MKNYHQSNYALNKNTCNIVYRFTDGTVEITLEEYLALNPGKTKKHYGRLKARSNAIYRDEARAENAQTKKNVPIDYLENVRDTDTVSPEAQYIERRDTELAAQAIRELLEGDTLTETQRRRFVLHIVNGLSMRKIALLEGTSHVAIVKTIQSVLRKIERYFCL